MLRGAIIWHIWCSRCGLVIGFESMASKFIGCNAWSDTIHVGMVHKSQIMKYAKLKSTKNQRTLEAEFVSIWCTSEVLCKSDFSHL